jgi:uncharacterized FlaG/YvyC family protein
VVEGAPITLWELDVEVRLRSLEQRGVVPTEPVSQTDREQALDQLINQRLAAGAADRFKVQPPAEFEVDAELASLRETALRPVEEQLEAVGIPMERLRHRIRTKLRIRRLIEGRLRELIRISDEDVEEYIREHPSEASDATSMVREYLTRVRLQERSRRFFIELRERATIEILDPQYRNVR